MLTIVACGGSGTRMAPATMFVNKHLLPIGNGELMVDMPLKFLSWHKKIKDITIVTGSNHASQICDYIQDGEKYGFRRVEYAFQPKPLGIADVLRRVSHKDTSDGVLLILGDNYFSEPQNMFYALGGDNAIAWEFDIGDVDCAKAFGQADRDSGYNVVSITEKPSTPTHSRILTGLYCFPADVFGMVDKLSPSERGELEITDLLRMYMDKDRLDVFDVNGEWSDLGEQEPWAEFVASRRG